MPDNSTTPPRPKSFVSPAEGDEATGKVLDLAAIKPTGIKPTSHNAAVAVATGGAAADPILESQAAQGPKKRRGQKDKLTRTLTIRCTDATFSRFEAYCDREDVSYSTALVKLLDQAENGR